MIAHLSRYARTTADVLSRTNVVWPVGVLCAGVLAFASPEARPVVLPLVAIAGVAAVAVLHVYRIDGQLPVFDVGVLTILITALYSAVPLLGFWLGGLQWTSLTYLPLYLWNPGPAEVGAFSSRHVVYLASLTAAYLLGRGRAAIQCRPFRELRRTEIAALLICGVATIGYLTLLESVYGYSYDPSYRGLTMASAGAAAEKMPYIVRQVSHNVFAIYLLLKFCALGWLISHWHDWRWRTVLFCWLGVEGVSTVAKMGARTYFAMLLVASVLLYHRLVKPLMLAWAAGLALLLLGGLITYGLARDLADPSGTSGLTAIANTSSSRWATMNEFQALYGIAYELHARKQAGQLGPIPAELYATEFSQMFPSQILPFKKADPCVGYPVVDGVGVGCVLGVIAQSVIGFDWTELVIRGVVLGLLFAMIHRWYARRQGGYWTTMLYLCLCLWCYYTFRGSTFFIAYYVAYRFLPLLAGITVVEWLVRRAMRAAAACGV
jgi:hypothetical protein